MNRRLAAFAVGIAAAVLVSGAEAAPPSLVVQTKNGAVAGVLVGTQKEWRGVPYAAPPIGALRWRPPAAGANWSGTRDATQFATPCIQYDELPDGTPTSSGDENCLYLNVFAPNGSTASSKLAVMVYLHPGGNFFGRANQDAHAFTNRNVIVVSVAYRLGVMGFMKAALGLRFAAGLRFAWCRGDDPGTSRTKPRRLSN